MQTRLLTSLLDTAEGREAEAILRKCVHCGFCTATCPTYQLLGDELDGPRGRIYLIKEMLEGTQPSRRTQVHLDRCLTCRACESACPSGVRYGRLLEIGRSRIERTVARPLRERLARAALLTVVPYRKRFAALVAVGRPILSRMQPPLAPPRTSRADDWPAPRHARRMLILEGCVQPVLAPQINLAAARLLDRLGISVLRIDNGCCGALAQHLSAEEQARAHMRRSIDAWWPAIELGVEALVVTASGCGAMVCDYAHLLQEDRTYAHKARKVAGLLRDISEVVTAELAQPDSPVSWRPTLQAERRIAFHSPCTLQNALKIQGVVEPILERAGFVLTPVTDSHLCCGSAGSYSFLQPTIARRLRRNKIAALQGGAPEIIVTANIGCLLHLASGTDRPVRHWIELLAEQVSA